MPMWLKKSLVVLISALTFGMVSPSDLLADQKDAGSSEKRPPSGELHESVFIEPELSRDEVIQQLTDNANEIVYSKLGERIIPRIEDEVNTIVLPKIEEAIEEIVKEYSEEDYAYLVIGPSIGKGDGERIFNVMDQQTGKDIIRFHVRKDQPPLEGYTFNFHYHHLSDGYETHHDLAKVYWGKDTPAKFGSKNVH